MRTRVWMSRALCSGAAAAALCAAAAPGSAAVVASGTSGGQPATLASGVTAGPAGAAFYKPPATLPAGKPGTVIWARRIPAPRNAIAYKVLYKSTVTGGQTVPVSGLVIAPRGPAPKGGRPVVAWAHGTLGGAQGCAPSIPANPAVNLSDYYTYTSSNFIDVGIPGLTTMLKAGYVVTATDYQGLGAPGIHQYTVGVTEADNVIDSVKAAQNLGTTGAGDRVVTLGWSQGGGAAIFTGQQSEAAYAAPLKVVGIAALAPAANTAPDITQEVPAGPVDAQSPETLAVQQLNLYRGLAAAYPGLDLSDVVSPAGMPVLQALGTECTIHLADTLQELGVDPRTFFTGPAPADWQAAFEANTAGLETTVAPVLTMQGTADTIVNPFGTTQYIQRACTYAEPVEYTMYPGINHQLIPFAAMDEYLPWIAARFAGRPAPSNCS